MISQIQIQCYSLFKILCWSQIGGCHDICTSLVQIWITWNRWAKLCLTDADVDSFPVNFTKLITFVPQYRKIKHLFRSTTWCYLISAVANPVIVPDICCIIKFILKLNKTRCLFLCPLWSIAAHGDHWGLSVNLSCSHTFRWSHLTISFGHVGNIETYMLNSMFEVNLHVE